MPYSGESIIACMFDAGLCQKLPDRWLHFDTAEQSLTASD